MLQENVEVLWNQAVGPAYFRIGLTGHPGYQSAVPGQFVMLRLSAQTVPFLRRPFSIHRRIDNDNLSGIEILYKVVGVGTQILAGFRKGDRVDMLGPLGNGFSYQKHYQHIAIAAGGIGVAPMPFLAAFLQNQGVDPTGCKVYLGGRTTNDLLCAEDFRRMGMDTHLTTDDGSAGDQCLVTHPLEQAMQARPADIIYACGPLEMLKCVLGIAEKYGIPCQVSIETVMACGIGACLGCAVETKDAPGRYKHACVDGPVFDADILKI
jgi:dihydroorotate dehydrogenase electron transfer subunit